MPCLSTVGSRLRTPRALTGRRDPASERALPRASLRDQPSSHAAGKAARRAPPI